MPPDLPARSEPAETAQLDQGLAKAKEALARCTSFILVVEYEEKSGAGELIGACDTEFLIAAGLNISDRIVQALIGGEE